MLSQDSEDEFDQDLCLNLWHGLKKLLWQDELNPRVRCAFGNVFTYKGRVPEENNSERPVDALAEKHEWLTHNLKSRDASASKNGWRWK